MSRKVSLSVAVTVTLIAMAVTFSITMVLSMNMFNNTVTSVKNRERMYNKLSEIDRDVRANEYFDIKCGYPQRYHCLRLYAGHQRQACPRTIRRRPTMSM